MQHNLDGARPLPDHGRRQADLPPGFDSHPAVQMLRWIRDPFGLLEEGQARFGDAFTLRLPRLPTPMVVLADPEAIKDVFALGPDQADTGKANAILKPIFGEHSLFLLDGAEHARQRKMMLPAFHGDRMHAYGCTMLEMAHDAIDAMPVDRSFPLLRPMQAITMQTMLRTVFGVEQSPRSTELAADLTRMMDAGTRPLRIVGALLVLPLMQHDLVRNSPLGRIMGLATRAEGILRGEIRRGREQGTAGRSDVMAMMLDARDDAGEALGEDEIHDELLTLLLAGYETTATALAWAMRCILPDRSLVARLRDEIATAGGDPMKIARLELLDATVKESMRLQPAVPNVARVLRGPAKLGRTELPAGALVAPAIYLVHRRASLYPEPGSFRPERFLGWKPAAWEWLPFGGGSRRCIGAAFALYEMKMVLAALLPRVDMRLATDKVRPVRRAVTITPSDGLGVVVTAKRSRPLTSRVQ
jgi:cytochrome P450